MRFIINIVSIIMDKDKNFSSALDNNVEFNKEQALDKKDNFYYLEDVLMLSSSYNKESLDKVESELLEVYDSIYNHDPSRAMGSTGNHCKRCDYRDMCPFFKNKSKLTNWDGDFKKI